MINKKTFKLSIIIPCYNEKNTIKKVIERINQSLEYYKILRFEILIVDDLSNDGTKEILNNLTDQEKIKIYFHNRNLGKGAAIHTALKYANSDITIIQDADLEYDPFDYDKLLVPFFDANADVVYGSRFLGGGKYVRIHFFWHFLANKILTFICNLFVNLNLSDMETGYKAFKTSALKSIELKEKTFSFEPEVTIKLAKKKYKFFEVPITYNGRSYEEGKKIGLKDAFIALKTIILYSFKN